MIVATQIEGEKSPYDDILDGPVDHLGDSIYIATRIVKMSQDDGAYAVEFNFSILRPGARKLLPAPDRSDCRAGHFASLSAAVHRREPFLD
jgi:hypothetical protein